MCFLRKKTFCHTEPQYSYKDYYLIHRPYLDFISCLQRLGLFFSWLNPGSNLEVHVSFSCHISLISFKSDIVSQPSFFITFLFLKNIGLLFCTVFLNLSYHSSWLDLGYSFWAGLPKEWYILLGISHWEAHDPLFQFDGISFDPLVCLCFLTITIPPPCQLICIFGEKNILDERSYREILFVPGE